MRKLFSVFALALMALIASSPSWVPAQDTAVDESIASILSDVEAEPVADGEMEAAAPTTTALDEEAPAIAAVAESTHEEAVVDTAVATDMGETADEEVVATETAVAPVDVAGGETIIVSDLVVPEVAEAAATVRGAQNGSDSDEPVRVSMAFEESPLPDVIRAFREASGANIISGWTNTTPHLVSARLDNVEWSVGLSAIVASYGLELKEEPRGSTIYTIREKVTVEVDLPRFTETFELKHAQAQIVSSILQYTLGISALESNMTMQARAGIDTKSITAAFPAANIVVVKGTEEQLQSCRSIITSLDIPTRQVYIEARFVRLNASASKKLGMKWDSLSDWGVNIDNLHAGYEVASGRTGSANYTMDDRVTTVNRDGSRRQDYPYAITKSTRDGTTVDRKSGYGGQLSLDKFRLAMSAFEQLDGAQLFSNPKIIVENGTRAVVDMTTKVPSIQVKIEDSSGDNGQSKIESSLSPIPGVKEPWVGEAFYSYGITLEVTPRISPTGLITVNIKPTISSLDESYSDVISIEGTLVQEKPGYMIVGLNKFPIIKMQSLDTTFTMGDGKTAVIGGLTETSESNVDSGIPLLRKIPWVGPRLFGWKSRQKIQSEIIVFVSVGIIDGTTIEEGAGMPKNAVIGRGLLDGSLKEPGDRTDEEMFDLGTKAKGFRIK